MQEGTSIRIALLISLGIVVGVAGTIAISYTGGTGMLTSSSISPAQAGEIVQDAMEAQGFDVSVESTESVSPSMYQVILDQGQDSLTTMYVSKDGNYIFQNPTNATEFTKQEQARTDFLDCMRSENVQIIGISQQQPTQIQLQALGGVTGLQDIYQEANNQTLQQLVSQGVQQLPVTFYDGTLHQGVQTVPQLSNLTGCEFTGAVTGDQ